MRADRLLSILLLLQTHGRLTVRTLSGILDVSERTIQRDMEALSMAGIPVYADRGVGGGWSLLEGFATQLTELTPIEIETLFLAKPTLLLMDLGLAKAADSALDKLFALLPTAYRHEAAVMRKRIHIDLMNLPCEPEQTTFLPLVQIAVRQERQIKMTYQMSNGVIMEACVAPLGLVARGSLWYLIAFYADQGIRVMGVYRVARIKTAYMTDQPVNRPKDFDLADCWEKQFAQLMLERNQYQVTAHVHSSILLRLRNSGRLIVDETDRPIPAMSEDRNKVTLCFNTAEEASEYLLAFGPKVEVLTPLALREMIYALAYTTARRYEFKDVH